jgi:flagellar biosynthesis/type III secretory pathway protein FliH
MSIYTIIRDDAIQEGIQRGLQEGVLAGEKRALLRVLHTKFGELPQAVTERVNALSSTDEVETLFDRILTAQTLDEMGLSGE